MRNPRAAPAYRGGKLKRETRLAAFMGFMQRVRETRAQKLLMVATVNVRDNDAPTPRPSHDSGQRRLFEQSLTARRLTKKPRACRSHVPTGSREEERNTEVTGDLSNLR